MRKLALILELVFGDVLVFLHTCEIFISGDQRGNMGSKLVISWLCFAYLVI